VLDNMAVVTALGRSVWKRHHETLAPGQRKTFADLVGAWRAMLLQDVERRLGEEAEPKEAPDMAKKLTKLPIDEISHVDHGAGDDVKVLLMKRPPSPAMLCGISFSGRGPRASGRAFRRPTTTMTTACAPTNENRRHPCVTVSTRSSRIMGY
jgi:hypothetical protein